MSVSDDNGKLDICGCCEGITPRTRRYNRPGKPAIDYRLDTHGMFMRRMIASIPTQLIPDGENKGSRPLGALAVRSTDDPTIAILDAWAAVADVLTFYQERIANECFLRTATERHSVLELARAIGYELKPGVAASTYLAFTLEDARDAPGHATIDAGIKVMSIPGQDEKPQTFETIERIEARAEWNAMKPRMAAQKPPVSGDKEAYLKGIATGLKLGDWLLFVGKEEKGSVPWDFRQVMTVPETVTAEPDAGYTKVTWDGRLKWDRKCPTDQSGQNEIRVYAFRQRAALFGHNAPDWRAMSDSVKEAYLKEAYSSLNLIPTYTFPTAKCYLSYESTGYRLGCTSAIPTDDSQWPGFDITPPYIIHLDAVYSQILPGSWLVLSIPECHELSTPKCQKLYQAETVDEDSQSNFTLTAKTTRVKLEGDMNQFPFADKRRETVVFAQSELLEMAEAPITGPVTGESITLDRRVDDLIKEQLLIISGKEIESGELHSEVVTLLKTEPDGDVTKISFTPPLHHSYKRDTVTINANVARATHGESVIEVLGKGDGTQANQRFALKKPPPTYVSAHTPRGTLSTLDVRVNGIQWQEAPSLYGLDMRSQNYIVRIDDDGRTNIIFGDGRSGARLPTGVENVKAVYRSGTGPDGEVSAGSLTLLQTRPLGVRGVINPLPASGAESQEKLSDARRNAPVTVLTLDRIVSLRDFENFARSFAGIGKAHASTLKVGQNRIVHITVAAANGSKVEGEPLKNLCDAIDLVHDPIEHVQVKSFRLRTFKIEADVLVDPRYLPEDVLAQVEKNLRDAFSFENRDFGQPVTAAEVLSLMQAVKGVVAVDLDKLELDPPSDTPVPSMRSNSVAGTSSTPGMSARGNVVIGRQVMLDPRFLQFHQPIKHVSRMSGLVSPSAILTSEKAQVRGEKILLAELLLLNPAAEGVGLKELKT